MNKNEFISAAIVSFNSSEKTEKICRLLLEYTKKYPLKLYVIDNQSTDNTIDIISKIDGVTLIENNKNIGFGAAHNMVLKNLIGKYHFVINPDIEIKTDVLSDMTDFLEQNLDIVMAMPKICNTDGTEQKLPKQKPTFKKMFLGRLAFLGGIFKKIRNDFVWNEKNINDVTDIDFCSGCFFVIKGDIFKELNGFDERYFMYLEDADLTLRAKKLGRVVIIPKYSVTHIWERESAKNIKYLLIHTSSSFKFLKKWRNYTI